MEQRTAEIAIKVKADMLYEQAIKRWNIKNPVPLKVDFNLRGRRAGTAMRYGGEVKYNIGMAMANFETFMADTVGHEVAHIVQFQLRPNSKPHGNEWKMIMRSFGQDTNRCHSMQVVYKPARNTSNRYATVSNGARATTKVHAVHCRCRTHMVTKNMLNKIVNGSGHYCTRCKCTLHVGSL